MSQSELDGIPQAAKDAIKKLREMGATGNHIPEETKLVFHPKSLHPVI